MKKFLFIVLAALLAVCSVISTSAAPIQVGVVEDADEFASVETGSEQATVAADYVATAQEYENLQYGEVITWEGYEGYEVGATPSSELAAYTNAANGSGYSLAPVPNNGKVCKDEATGVKYLSNTGSEYLHFGTPKLGKPGRYTVVITARKSASNPQETFTVIFRSQKKGADGKYADNNLKWPASETLTAEFKSFVYQYDYKPADVEAEYMHQLLIYASLTTDIDSYGVYYKPFDNYEKPELGEVIFWEGYETKTIGANATGTPTVYNSTNSANAGNTFLDGVVSASSPTGARYATVTGTKYKDFANNSSRLAKAGTYTFVVRARKGASDTLSIYLRRTKFTGGDLNSAEVHFNGSNKLTDTFKEYSLSINYTPDDVSYLRQILFMAGAGVEVDSFALYYKPFNYAPETIDMASIRSTNDGFQGMRYAGLVDSEKRGVAVEYGFVISLGSFFNSADDYTKLTFDSNNSQSGENGDGIRYVSGSAYLTEAVGKTPSLDKIFSTTGEPFGMDKAGTYFTAVIYNITKYDEIIVGRPYLKISDGTVYYGEPIARSVKEVAAGLLESHYNNDLSTAPDYIKTVLG